jgi:Uma2 family endonuclease
MSIAETQASLLPTHLELPHTDDKPVENAYQPEQSTLLTTSLLPHLDRLYPDGRYFIGADCGVYWELKKEPLEGCRSPDWYFVPNVPRTLDGTYRRSYVMWQESIPPLLVVGYVSGNGSEERDDTPETGKFWVYERGIKAAYYAIHDPDRCTLEVFHLVRGRYQPMKPNAAGRFRIPAMELDLGIWEGMYHGYPANWLRAWDWDGAMIPTQEEVVELQQQHAEKQQQIIQQERQRDEQQQQIAQQERQRAEALAARLRELGIDPNAT